MINGSGPAVIFDHVSKSFGSKQVLRDVSFDIGSGEALCILGRSGTGKSVTLKLIISLLKPDQGKIWVEQDEITRLDESRPVSSASQDGISVPGCGAVRFPDPLRKLGPSTFPSDQQITARRWIS